MNAQNTVKLTFRSTAGDLTSIDAPLGESVMQAAIFNNVDGIEAECGGSCMCATCHIYVAPALLGELIPAAEEEIEMLDETAAERRAESRLSCQLVVTSEMDGQVFDVPECQS